MRLTILLAALGTLGFAGAARADLRLCNDTTGRIGVAVGYQDAKGWATEGWWNLAAQSCETLLRGSVPSRYVYVYAVDYDRGGEWTGGFFMCTQDKSFRIRDNTDCESRGFRRTGFMEVDTTATKDWMIRFADPQ